MFPTLNLFGIEIDMYTLCLCAGIFVCILAFGRLADMVGLEYKLQKFCFLCACFAIPLGYGAAVLAQAVYNIGENGGFVVNSETGATFYGGLIGGAATFLLIYFVAGRFMFPDGYHKRAFFRMSSCAGVSITAAHGMGRIGCLMAGCCHGRATDAWYGIDMNGGRFVPVQLYEAMFLFALCGVLIFLVLKGFYGCLPVYMMTYGVWRFFIEYARADERGETVVSFLSPSQLTAAVLVAAGVVLLVFERRYNRLPLEG